MNQPVMKIDDELVESIELLQIFGTKYTNSYEKMGKNELIKEIVNRDRIIE